jgi:dTDP-glucose 4,6-dehydratase
LLSDTDWTVTALDRASGHFGLKRLRDLGLLNNKRLTVIQTDFAASGFVESMKEQRDYDVIFHLGAKASVNESRLDPDAYLYSNIQGTQKMLDFALLQDSLKGFIYVSTNEVFGPGERDKAFSEWDSYNSQSVYAATKAAGEELCLAYSVQHKVNTLSVHTMNIFGERQPPEKFIPQIVKSLVSGHSIPVYYHGDTEAGSRTYLDVCSFSDALIFLAQKLISGSKELQRNKVNIAGSEFISNNALAEKIAGIIGLPYKLEWIDFYKNNPGHIPNSALSTRFLSQLGWRPLRDFDEGLKRTVTWWLNHLNWPNE